VHFVELINTNILSGKSCFSVN